MRTELGMANQKQIEAEQWRLIFDVAVSRYRRWTLVWIGRNRIYWRLASEGIAPSRLFHLEVLIAEARDLANIAYESAVSAAHSATACEMAARIYYEEVEGREHARLRKRESDEKDVV
jgi:hypothetical protein